jgi:hypothetical protein
LKQKDDRVGFFVKKKKKIDILNGHDPIQIFFLKKKWEKQPICWGYQAHPLGIVG